MLQVIIIVDLEMSLSYNYALCMKVRRLLQPRGDIGDKLPLSIKCPSRRASQIASDNQSPTPSLLVWLKNKPGGTASTDRRRGEGE